MASTHQLHVAEIFSVKDYVCLITGGGTGIGLMCTQALAANGDYCLERMQWEKADVLKAQRYTSLAEEWRCWRMPPNLITQMEEGRSYRMMTLSGGVLQMLMR